MKNIELEKIIKEKLKELNSDGKEMFLEDLLYFIKTY